MERMKTQVELLKESCDIKDAACVRYQKRIAELEEENKKLREELAHYKNTEAIQKSNAASSILSINEERDYDYHRVKAKGGYVIKAIKRKK